MTKCILILLSMVIMGCSAPKNDFDISIQNNSGKMITSAEAVMGKHRCSVGNLGVGGTKLHMGVDVNLHEKVFVRWNDFSDDFSVPVTLDKSKIKQNSEIRFKILKDNSVTYEVLSKPKL